MSRTRTALLAVLSICVGVIAAPTAQAAPYKFSSLTSGAYYSCALKTGGTPVCWGWDTYGEQDAPSDLGPVRSIVAGYYGTCAIDAQSAAVCWGTNADGPTTVPSDLGPVTAITGGGFHYCAIKRATRTVACWGATFAHQTDVPSTLGRVKALAAGARHTCAIKLDDTVACWGESTYGATKVPLDLGTVKAIAAGGSYTCAIKTDGTPVCWGTDDSGAKDVPSSVGTVTAITAKDAHTCAITSDGAVVCWGTPAETSVPSDLGPVTAIAAGADHTCAVKTDGTLRCWGEDYYGAVNNTPVSPTTSTRATVSISKGVASAYAGTWTGSPTFDYRWQRCDATTCTAISGTTDADDGNASYTPTSADVGKRLRVKVTATTSGGTAASTSATTAPIGSRPTSVSAPTISAGSYAVGSVLTAGHGDWSDAPATEDGYAYAWQQCSGSPVACTSITGATASTYTLTGDDAGKRIRLVVVATNAVGSKTASSALTTKITG